MDVETEERLVNHTFAERMYHWPTHAVASSGQAAGFSGTKELYPRELPTARAGVGGLEPWNEGRLPWTANRLPVLYPRPDLINPPRGDRPSSVAGYISPEHIHSLKPMFSPNQPPAYHHDKYTEYRSPLEGAEVKSPLEVAEVKPFVICPVPLHPYEHGNLFFKLSFLNLR